ncbi:MAG: cytochrome b N-terminal domain-containing protein [Bryobacteraceae bacterium]|nr:cytochrome b N-terminal domain-containing protein [Bryobacteraceae bacterium]
MLAARENEKRGPLGWLEDRLGLESVREFIAHKSVPKHSATMWYYFGGITLFLFVIQVLTGILLLLYYRPTTAEAYESVQFIVTQVKFGWLIRSIHSWSANLMILTAFIHMFSVVFLHAYRKPREATWLSGIALLGLALGFGFSGYLLPWNTVSYFATKVGTDMAASLPVIGPPVARFLRGGDEVGGATLTRFFGFHVAVLPGITTVMLLVHLALVQRWNISVPPWVERQFRDRGREVPRMPFAPNFFLRELMAWYAALAGLGILAALFPWELGDKADPFAPAPAGIHPEWYFLAPFYTLKLIPSNVWFIEGELLGLIGFGLLAVWWVCLPFWATDRAGQVKTRLVTGAGVFLLSYLAIFSALGYWQ